MHTIILYYKYVRIEDPEALKEEQLSFCREHNLKGRILIATEGINGTLEGTKENVQEYMNYMKADPRFSDIHWKISEGTGNAFPKLKVKVRPEIVATKLEDDDIDPNEITGIHLKPEELKQKFENKEDLVIIDMRNDYEYRLGHFENSLFSGMENFRDLKKVTDTFEDLKDKEVLTVCTGGVRCEKASGYLLKKGFKKVYQLDGGIVSYMEKYPADAFKGSLYVFDDRIKMHFDPEDKHEVVARCDICEQPSENMVNCGNLNCHKHIVFCESCSASHKDPFCSTLCKEALNVKSLS